MGFLLFRGRYLGSCPHSDWSYRPSTSSRTLLHLFLVCLLVLETILQGQRRSKGGDP